MWLLDLFISLSLVSSIPLLHRSDNSSPCDLAAIRSKAKELITLAHARAQVLQYDAAEELFEQALELLRDSGQQESWLYGSGLALLGANHNHKGNVKAAESTLLQAVRILKREAGEKHQSYAAGLSRLGLVYSTQGKLQQAMSLHAHALAINELALGVHNQECAVDHINLGSIWLILNDYDRADACCKRGKDILDRYKPRDVDLVFFLIRAGEVALGKGDADGAEHLFEEALATLKSKLGEDHFLAFDLIRNQGLVQMNRQNYEKAETMLTRALELSLQSPRGKEHPCTASCFEKLGKLHLARGQFAEARVAFSSCLAIREKQMPSDSPAIADALDNQASALERLGNSKEAQLARARAQFIRLRAMISASVH